MRLELVPVPVRDIDRAKAFYADALGFTVDHDTSPTTDIRVVQLTPQGSACSVVLTEGLPGLSSEPGSVRGLHLVVGDIELAREELVGRGVEVDDITDLGRGVRMSGFADPDGNTWLLQQIGSRDGG